MKKPICCICGKECENEWGNNPYPLVKDENARCCDECNMLVIAERLGLLVLKENQDIPGFEGTLEQLDKLTIEGNEE